MSRLRVLFRCIGEAVCAKGMKALVSIVPFGEALFDIAEDAWQRLRRSAREEEQLAAVAEAARATVEEARREAQEAVREIRSVCALPEGADLQLVRYLTQVPSAVRQSLKRPSDPTGKTVPPAFSLRQAEQLLPLLPRGLPRFRPGDRPPGVGNWELEELLGTGGFGEVWKARHPTLAGIAPVALKFCLDPGAAAYLRHEAALLDRVMQQSSHPGIIPLRQAYLDSDPVCLEYEYVSGGDLVGVVNDWAQAGKVPRRQVNRLVLRLAEIVGHAHTLMPPIVHRDLKPANILVQRTPDNKVRLRVADFGIGGIAATRSAQATRSGTTRGGLLSTSLRGAHTPIYASPQQQKGEAPDPRDDVHALGVIWYQLLTADLASGIPADWSTVLADLGQPRPLVDLLGTCLASRPDKRLASAAILAERLEKELEADRILDVLPVAEPPLVAVPATVRPGPSTPTVRPAPQELLEVLPVTPAPATQRPSAAPSAAPSPTPAPVPARSGNQVCRFPAAGLHLPELVAELENWLVAQDFHVQQLATEDGATLLQIDQKSTWRQLTGMSTALNIIVKQIGEEWTVEIGAGRWVDKAAAGAVSLFVLWPLAVTAAIGAWNQVKMPEKIFARIREFVTRRQGTAPTPTTAPKGSDTLSQLRELAALRDQGILTDAEFQAQKTKLLG